MPQPWIDYKDELLRVVLSRFSSGLFRTMFAMKERWNGKKYTAEVYRKTGNFRAVQLLLGHTKVDSTVRYLGVELENALHPENTTAAP